MEVEVVPGLTVLCDTGAFRASDEGHGGPTELAEVNFKAGGAFVGDGLEGVVGMKDCLSAAWGTL